MGVLESGRENATGSPELGSHIRLPRTMTGTDDGGGGRLAADCDHRDLRGDTVRAFDLSPTSWRKSSRSNGGDDQTDCVEVAELPGRVAMRDSKDPGGPVLAFSRAEWRAFLGVIRSGEFD